MCNTLKLKTPTCILYDRVLLWLTLSLACIGFVMVTSSSISIGECLLGDPLHFSKRNAIYLILAFIISLVMLRIPMKIWQRYSSTMLLTTLAMLFLVLIVGDAINGASRWIALGPLCMLQPAELSKLALFCYLSNYLMQKSEEVQKSFWGFFKPVSVTALLTILLLAQPDLGNAIVLFITTLAMLFLVGAKLCPLLFTICSSLLVVIILIIAKPYRMQRIISFWNPWHDPFGNGYQLTQSLMALGRGEFWGQGLGNSIQKLEYLPEAHTDFIFSILGEELGYCGVATALLIIFLIAFRAISIGRKALEVNQRFSGFLACSIGIWFSVQTSINVGTASGMLPITGLTFPLISYGGSSLLVVSTSIVFLLRIDFETRLIKNQAFLKESR